MKKSPCFNCEDRHPGCHADCQMYAEWSEEVKQSRKWLRGGYAADAYKHETIRRKVMAKQRKTKIIGGWRHE